MGQSDFNQGGENLYGRITPLAKDLKISRRRLKRFLDNDLGFDELTIAEYKAMAPHPLLSHLMESSIKISSDNGVLNGNGSVEPDEYIAVYRIKFYPDKVKYGIETYYKYIAKSNEAINCVVAVPFGDSSYHLLAMLQIDSIQHSDTIGLNAYSNHWSVRINKEQQAKWMETAIATAGSEEQFQQIWKEFNHAIEGVQTQFFCLNPQQEETPQLSLL
jgi:hypothetical protein